MHPVIARAITAEQISDRHAEGAAARLAREAGRSRRPRLARAGRAPQPMAAPRPARGPAAG
jgi:hypothetical protein